MALTVAAIQALRPTAAPYKVADGQGLYLLVHPRGSKYWRLKFRWAGKENTLSFGPFPDVPLEVARQRRDAARRMLAEGINPSEQAKMDRSARRDEQARQSAATRFLLDNFGALSIRLGRRCLALTAAEIDELRAFLGATRSVNPKERRCF